MQPELLELADDLGVVRVVAKARRRARARERGEDHLPARREARGLAAPEGRARREREQRAELGEQAVDDLDRLLGIVDRHVHVHPEDELAPGDVLHLVDQRPVAVLRRDALPLEEAERVRARRADPQALAVRDLGHVPAELEQLAAHVRRRAADGRRDLDHRLHQLGVDALLELVARDRVQHRLDVLHEVERLPVEELVLLLDSERVRVALAERVVEDAALVHCALAGDRGREGLLPGHGRIASTSISTFQAGSMRAVTTVVFTGRMSRKTSPCARAMPSKWAGSVTYIRVRTTFSNDAPALSSARPMISKQSLRLLVRVLGRR